jgi:hypothetical protein
LSVIREHRDLDRGGQERLPLTAGGPEPALSGVEEFASAHFGRQPGDT